MPTSSLINAVKIECREATKYICKVLPCSDRLNSGGLAKYCLNLENILLNHSFHAWAFFLKTPKKGKHLFVALSTNLFRFTTFLVNLCTSCMILLQYQEGFLQVLQMLGRHFVFGKKKCRCIPTCFDKSIV